MSEPPEDDRLSPRAEHPQEFYWGDRESRKLPPEFYERSFDERAFCTPKRLTTRPADGPGGSRLDAALDDGPGELERAAAVEAPPAPGGPRFVGVPASVAPIVPPGVRAMPVTSGPGNIAPVRPPAPAGAPPRSRRSRAERIVVRLLVVALVAGAGYAAYPRVRAYLAARSVPAGLRAYVEGHGVTYAPVAQGYSVRLPKTPVRRDGVLGAVAGQAAMVVHRSIVAGTGFQIAIRVDDLSPGAVLPDGLAGALHTPAVAGGAPVDPHPVGFAGQAAYDYQLASSPPTRLRMFRAGDRLYVISVQSKSAGTVLTTLMKSFRLHS